MGRGTLAPTPPGHWLLGQLPDRGRDPLRLFADSQRALGDVVRYRMAYVHVEQLTHPDHVRHVLVESRQIYRKGTTWDKTKPLIGNGLVTAEGELWRQQRRLVQPSFHADQLTRLTGTMTGAIEETLRSWAEAADRGEIVAAFPELRRLALRVVIRSLFGVELDDRLAEVSDAFATALEVTDRRIVSPAPYLPWLYRVPTGDNRAFRRSVALLHRIVAEILDRRQQRPDTATDLLGTLMAASRDDDGALDARQLRDELMTLLMAGFETTANALAWTVDLLDQHPEVADRLVADVDRELGGAVPAAADLSRLPYVRAVVEEVLRLRPPVWAVPRVPTRDDEVSGYRIPRGDIVILVPYVTHRHPDFWPEPEAFSPDRFLPENRARLDRRAYFPFGAGQRQCLGLHFAMLEAQLAMVMITQRFRIRRVAGPTEPDAYVTLRPAGPMPVRVERR